MIYYDKNKKTLEPLRKNILNALLKILRLENINTSDTRPYTKKRLIDLVREKDLKRYEELNLNLYNWSIGIIKGKTNDVWDEIKAYAPNLFTILSDNPLSTSLTFLNTDAAHIHVAENTELEATNHYKEDGLEIEITSVHSVKGQTHCATLYLESYFQKDGNGANAKSYESQRLSQQLLGANLATNIGDRVKQSAKMAYVGFSRPTDLLCIAVHKDRFDTLLNTISTDIWEIRTVEANGQV